MYITVTFIELKSPWYFFKLSWLGLKISWQARKTQGFIKMKNTGFGNLHYTLSAWENENSMKSFARSGAHLQAMKTSSQIAIKVGTYTYQAEIFPNWGDAKKSLQQSGKFLDL